MTAFPASQFNFLKQLRTHNDRVWFGLHKDDYQTTYAEFKEICLDIIAGLSEFDRQVFTQPDFYRVFRIYRDIRFRKDKTPYKEHYSCEVVRGGRDVGREKYYWRLKPGDLSLVGAGWFPRDKEDLFAMRRYVSAHHTEFTAVLERAEQRGFGLVDYAGKLKTTPRGFDPADPAIEYLRHKAWTIMRTLSDEEVRRGDYVERVVAWSRENRDYLAFFTKAQAEIDRHRGEYRRS